MENKAKEKAEELVEKFKHVTMSWNIQEECYDTSLEDQVKAAIIVVDELIIQNGELYLNRCQEEYYRSKNAFLFEVKEHLNAMK